MPLTFDMSLAELETYQGINPRPDNFDSFWEDALAEMQVNRSGQVEIVPASFQTSVRRMFGPLFHRRRRCAGSRYADSSEQRARSPSRRC